MIKLNRKQRLEGRGRESAFLWGPRQTGKSTLLSMQFPSAKRYDLLLSSEFNRLSARPALLREELLAALPFDEPVIIDEIQKIPALLDEVQWLIVNHEIAFILCGSSARKLKRGAANLLGGRALRYELFPLVSVEIPQFDLMRALDHGLMPRHYFAENPTKMIAAYIGDYLKEEIAAEALTRNVPAFSRFLPAAAFSNGEVVNYTAIASDCGVSLPTVKSYFEILEDTLIGRFLPSFRHRPKRRVIQAPKFSFFDVGVAGALSRRGDITMPSEAFGRAFEQLIYQELVAHRHYSGLEYDLTYWRTASGIEVDFILGDGAVAIEVKGVDEVKDRHCSGLKSFCGEYAPKRAIIVSCDRQPRKMGTIDVLPWRDFLAQLWAGEIGV